MKLKLPIDITQSSSTASNQRRASLDFSFTKRRRFSFGRRQVSISNLHHPNQEETEHAAMKTSSLLSGRPASVAAALLGSWTEEYESDGVFMDSDCDGAISHDDMSNDDTYVTLRPASQIFLPKPIISPPSSRRENSPMPKKSMMRSVKLAASSSTTRLMSSPVVRHLRRSSIQSMSPKRRSTQQFTHDFAKHKAPVSTDTYVILTGIKNSLPSPSGNKSLQESNIRGRSQSPLARTFSERPTSNQTRTIRSWIQRRSSPAPGKHPRLSFSPRSFVRQTSLPHFSFTPSKTKSSTLTRTKRKFSSPYTRSHSTKRLQCISLQDVLRNKELMIEFEAFLKKEFSEENLEFWRECESYSNQKQAKQAKLCSKIYNRFLKPMAPKEVNIDSKTRAEVLFRMTTPDENTFKSAQDHVYKLMLNDSFPRFLSTRLKSRKNID